MKKFLLVVISLVYLFVFASCNEAIDASSIIVTECSFDDMSSAGVHTYIDVDLDGYCDADWCRSPVQTSSNDVSSEMASHTCYDKSLDGNYQDSDFDRLCDICGSDLAHYCNDANGDGQCDKCFASFGIAHQDTTGDGYCDIHKKCRTYLLEHDHIDKNTDHKCDLCYLPF